MGLSLRSRPSMRKSEWSPAMSDNNGNGKPPIGQPFSQVYLERGTATKELSERFRNRIAAYATKKFGRQRRELCSIFETEIGCAVPQLANFGPHLKGFFIQAELRDALDAITYIFQYYAQQGKSDTDGLSNRIATDWLAFVARVFREENLAFRVDEEGGVRYVPDEEFERNRAAALTCLTGERHATVLAEFEAAYADLNEEPPKTNAAIRSIFLALENLTKLMGGSGTTRLDAKAVDHCLKPIVESNYETNKPALNATRLMLESLKEWVNAAQQYRHAQGTEEPAPAPLEFAVTMLSSGTSFLRWLAQIDTT